MSSCWTPAGFIGLTGLVISVSTVDLADWTVGLVLGVELAPPCAGSSIVEWLACWRQGADEAAPSVPT